MLWTALRYCLSCLDVTPGTGDAMVCLPPVWWRSRVLQAQQLPPLLAMSSKPFDYYATFFPPSAHLGASVGSHAAADIRAFLQDPAHLTLPCWKPS